MLSDEREQRVSAPIYSPKYRRFWFVFHNPGPPVGATAIISTALQCDWTGEFGLRVELQHHFWVAAHRFGKTINKFVVEPCPSPFSTNGPTSSGTVINFRISKKSLVPSLFLCFNQPAARLHVPITVKLFGPPHRKPFKRNVGFGDPSTRSRL